MTPLTSPIITSHTPGDVLSVGLAAFTQDNIGHQFSFLQNNTGLTYGYGASGGILSATAITATSSSSSSSSSRTLLIAYSWLTQVENSPAMTFSPVIQPSPTLCEHILTLTPLMLASFSNIYPPITCDLTITPLSNTFPHRC